MAKKLFKSKLGKEIQKEVKKARTFIPGGGPLDSRPQMCKHKNIYHAKVQLIIS